jgi:uncharacterized protein (UPF0276 family)
MHYSELPILGVGLAADVGGRLPDYRKCLGDTEDTSDYLSFGAHYLQLNRIRYYLDDLLTAGLPLVFHPINLNVALADDEDVSVLKQTIDIAEYCHSVWTGQDVGMWTVGGQYLGSFLVPAIFDQVSINEVAKKVTFLNKVLPCPFLVENPPVGFSLETMHVLDFMRAVAEEADCGIVLDIGHLIGYQQATARAPMDMPLERFPFERVIEVHMAGLQFSQVGNDVNIIDQHSYPVHELCWEFLEAHVHRMTSLKGRTLEQEFCEDELVRKHLRKARALTRKMEILQCKFPTRSSNG